MDRIHTEATDTMLFYRLSPKLWTSEHICAIFLPTLIKTVETWMIQTFAVCTQRFSWFNKKTRLAVSRLSWLLHGKCLFPSLICSLKDADMNILCCSCHYIVCTLWYTLCDIAYNYITKQFTLQIQYSLDSKVCCTTVCVASSHPLEFLPVTLAWQEVTECWWLLRGDDY